MTIVLSQPHTVGILTEQDILPSREKGDSKSAQFHPEHLPKPDDATERAVERETTERAKREGKSRSVTSQAGHTSDCRTRAY